MNLSHLLPIETAPEGAVCADCPLPLATYSQYAERSLGAVAELICKDCAVSS